MTINQLEKAYKILIDEINGKDKNLDWNIRYAIFGYLYGDKMQKHSSKDLNAMCEKLKQEGYNASKWTKDFKCLSNIREKELLEKEYTILTLDELESQWQKLGEISIGDVTYKGYAISLLFSSSFEDLNVIKSFAERVVSRDRGFKETIHHIQRGKVLREWIMNKGFNRSKTVEELESVGDVLGSQETPKNDSLEKLKPYSHNRIIFGAPGTGKSHLLKENVEEIWGGNNVKQYVTRVTFHPDYSYAHFVGTYKPVMVEKDGKKDIEYNFVPGPFLTTYKKAIQDKNNSYVLIIEEINRANVAAVFGDVFQLLDRKDGVSEYPIQASADIKKWLLDENVITKEEWGKDVELSIPSNMYIWATMNSADQGVFPMDTAFKRRWTFEYRGKDKGATKVNDYTVELPNGQKCNWNALREKINERLITEAHVNEDKCLGPFFVNKKDCANEIIFASKVLMYLFEDVVKQKPNKIFHSTFKDFSSIYNAFISTDPNTDDKRSGFGVFVDEIGNVADEGNNS